jgi:hypothetical protein
VFKAGTETLFRNISVEVLGDGQRTFGCLLGKGPVNLDLLTQCQTSAFSKLIDLMKSSKNDDVIDKITSLPILDQTEVLTQPDSEPRHGLSKKVVFDIQIIRVCLAMKDVEDASSLSFETLALAKAAITNAKLASASLSLALKQSPTFRKLWSTVTDAAKLALEQGQFADSLKSCLQHLRDVLSLLRPEADGSPADFNKPNESDWKECLSKLASVMPRSPDWWIKQVERHPIDKSLKESFLEVLDVRSNSMNQLSEFEGNRNNTKQ